jgi:hypothetical protein
MNQNCAIVTMHPVPYTPVQSNPSHRFICVSTLLTDRQPNAISPVSLIKTRSL